MDNLRIYEFQNSSLRTIMINNEPHFQLEDVAMCLGITTTVNGEEYVRWNRVEGYLQQNPRFATFGKNNRTVPEPVLYYLCMKTNNEISLKFQDWLCFEVLPSIRKTGSYSFDKMEVARMISECKSATGVKSIMRLFESDLEPKSEPINESLPIDDFIKNFEIVGRKCKDVLNDYINYSGDNITQTNFSKELSKHGYDVKRHRVNGTITRFYF